MGGIGDIRSKKRVVGMRCYVRKGIGGPGGVLCRCDDQ